MTERETESRQHMNRGNPRLRAANNNPEDLLEGLQGSGVTRLGGYGRWMLGISCACASKSVMWMCVCAHKDTPV